MKQSITLSDKDAETLIADLNGWAETLASDPGGYEHPWVEEMMAHARMLTDKLAGRIE